MYINREPDEYEDFRRKMDLAYRINQLGRSDSNDFQFKNKINTSTNEYSQHEDNSYINNNFQPARHPSEFVGYESPIQQRKPLGNMVSQRNTDDSVLRDAIKRDTKRTELRNMTQSGNSESFFGASNDSTANNHSNYGQTHRRENTYINTSYPQKDEILPWQDRMSNQRKDEFRVNTSPRLPYIDRRLPFDEFMDVLGFRESSNNYRAENDYGYLGRFQFGTEALIDVGYKDANGNWSNMAKSMGIYSNEDFLNNPRAQNDAMKRYLNKNWHYIIDCGLDKYIGTVVDGVVITESGLLAAAHLIGVPRLNYAMKNGTFTSERDGYKTPAIEYMKNYGGYNVDQIK